MDQLEYGDFLVDNDRRGRFDNPPGLYVFYVRDNIAPPADFFSSRQRRAKKPSPITREGPTASFRQTRKSRFEDGSP
jgi:hypothetical protein